MKQTRGRILLMAAFTLLAACIPSEPALPPPIEPTATSQVAQGPTPIPIRTPFPPGEVFDYTAQVGDTLPALASHFNTSVEEILTANPDLPANATTLPPGFVIRVPAYYRPLTASAFHIVPDSEVIYGPGAVGFDLRSEVLRQPGFLKELDTFAYARQREAWQVVQVVSENYSLNPRLLLALLEYQTQALSLPFPAGEERTYPLGVRDPRYRGLFWQLVWAAERLNNGYYGWRTGRLETIELADGLTLHLDPWQNAGTIALQNLFAGLYGEEDFQRAVGPLGFYQTYVDLWGDPFEREVEFIPGGLQQPPLALPFEPNVIWSFTGGPHPSWGSSLPYGALDFAPPASETGCAESALWATAPAAGVIVRSGQSIALLDLDGDGDERTGWTLFYYHLAKRDLITAGTKVEQGDFIGHPSCEGGRATGTHVHIARRYNGEWIPATGPLAYNLDGWIASGGDEPYQGELTKASKVVKACTCSTAENRILYTLPTEE